MPALQLPISLRFSCRVCSGITELFSTFSAVNLDFLAAVSADCLFPLNLYSRLAVIVTTPIAVVLGLQLFARKIRPCWRRRGRQKIAVAQAHSSHHAMLQQRWALPVAQPQRPDAAAEVFEEAWQQHKAISSANQNSMLIVFLAYPMLSSTIFSVFACRELDFGQSVHIYDAQID
eukprot:SAG31_NODE_8356_length_1466_cov_1.986832_2_plen_175_part_00